MIEVRGTALRCSISGHRQRSLAGIAPGTTKLKWLEENIGAAEIKLTSDDLREIASAAAKITVQGARYPENLERMTGR